MADQDDAGLAGLSDLDAYIQQQEEVARMLLDDPENEELQAIYSDLAEVIQLAREVQGSVPAEAGAAAASAADAPHEQHEQLGEAGGAMLPPQMAEQIRHVQQRAAIGGQGPAAWAVGAKCRALYSADGSWYDAVVESVTEDGSGFVVVFEEYGNKEQVTKDAIQLLPEEEEGTYKGVAAPKRRKVDESVVVEEMPTWLEVKPTDDEKTKQKKKKLQKSYKSKARFARLDQQTKQKADAWKTFLAGKNKTKTKRAAK